MEINEYIGKRVNQGLVIGTNRGETMLLVELNSDSSRFGHDGNDCVEEKSLIKSLFPEKSYYYFNPEEIRIIEDTLIHSLYPIFN